MSGYSEEPNVGHKEELTESAQHHALFQLAEEAIDDEEDYEKECEPIDDKDDPNNFLDEARDEDEE